MNERYLISDSETFYTLKNYTDVPVEYRRVRFLRCWSNGSNMNTSNHYIEIKMIDKDGVNRASKLSVTTNSTGSANLERVTDGVISSDYAELGSGYIWVMIDLGSICDISTITVWHYYPDSRTYYHVKFEVSTDGETFEEIFNSDNDGTYSESSSGKTIQLSSVIHEGGELESLETLDVSAALFTEHGIDFIPQDVVLELTDPKVWVWTEETEQPVLIATENAIPPKQVIFTPNYDMTNETIKGIECAYVTATEDVVFALSFDGGTTWMIYTGETWAVCSDEWTGMTAATLTAITTEQWAEQATTGHYMIRAVLFTEESSITSFLIDYLN